MSLYIEYIFIFLFNILYNCIKITKVYQKSFKKVKIILRMAQNLGLQHVPKTLISYTCFYNMYPKTLFRVHMTHKS